MYFVLEGQSKLMSREIIFDVFQPVITVTSWNTLRTDKQTNRQADRKHTVA